MHLGVDVSSRVFRAAAVLLLGIAVFALVTHVKIDQFHWSSGSTCQSQPAKMTEPRGEFAWSQDLTVTQVASLVVVVSIRHDSAELEVLLPDQFHRHHPFFFRPPPSC